MEINNIITMKGFIEIKEDSYEDTIEHLHRIKLLACKLIKMLSEHSEVYDKDDDYEDEDEDMQMMEQALEYISRADMLIIGGTSLVVYPAAGLVQYYRGHKLVVINKGEVGAGVRADLTIRAPIGEVLSQL